MNAPIAMWLEGKWSSSKPAFLRLPLLWFALGCVGFGLTAMVEYLQNSIMFWTGFCGVLSAWIIARSRQSGLRSSLIVLGGGILWLFLIVGRLHGQAGALLSSLFDLIIRSAFSHMSLIALNINPVFVAWKEFIAAFAVLLSRLGIWYQGVSTGGVVIDPIVTAMLWAALVWVVAAWAGWFVRRKETAFVGLLPASAVLAYNAFYTHSSSGFIWLVLLVGMMVILQAVNGYLSAQRRWLAGQMHYANVGPGLTAVVLGITGLLMLAGWFSPSISINEIKNTINNILEARQDQDLAKSLSLKQPTDAEGKGSNMPVGLPELSAQHRVGPGPVVSHDVVMYAAIQGFEPVPLNALQEIPSGVSPNRYQYWRGQTYESYTGSGWATHSTLKTDHSANDPLELPLENYRIVEQHVDLMEDYGGKVFVVGGLISVDQPYRVSWRSSSDMINAQTESTSYTAESRIPVVTVSQLRSAGTDYPESISKRYLKLPQNLPQRVRNLALNLTASQSTPYDQAATIEAYLRTIPYSLDVPAPPVNRDVTDFFLFDLKRGYCDYYATTMAVMARAVGIPSRLVIGYASGQFDYQRGQYVITMANAHAWVEIYFPKYGWVEFEPTAELPAIGRQGSETTFVAPTQSALAAAQQEENKESTFNGIWQKNIVNIWIAILAIALIALLLPIDRWTLLNQPTEAAITTIYHRLYRLGPHWGVEINAGRTPHEFARALTSRIQKLTKSKRLAPVIPLMLLDVDWLTELYTQLLFSPHLLTSADHQRAVRTWERLRQRLVWLRVIAPYLDKE